MNNESNNFNNNVSGTFSNVTSNPQQNNGEIANEIPNISQNNSINNEQINHISSLTDMEKINTIIPVASKQNNETIISSLGATSQFSNNNVQTNSTMNATFTNDLNSNQINTSISGNINNNSMVNPSNTGFGQVDNMQPTINTVNDPATQNNFAFPNNQSNLFNTNMSTNVNTFNQNQFNNNVNANNTLNNQGSGVMFDANNFNSEAVSLDNRLEKQTLESEVNDVDVNEEVETLSYDYKLAGVISRMLAYFIDDIVILLAGVILYIASSTIFIFIDNNILKILVNILIGMFMGLGFLVYRSANESRGTTIGRRTTNTLVVYDKAANMPISIALLRTFLSILINGTGIGAIANIVLICTDKDKRTLQDKICKTTVVSTKL